MKFEYRDGEIYYKFVDRKRDTTNIYLHGWGVSSESLLFCEEHMQNENSLYVDFPPFGKSSKKIKNWSVFTYANMLIALIEKLKLQKINIIGHSFGGRIAILVASINRQNVKKVVLIDSAGMKPKRKLGYYLMVWKYKRNVKKGKNVSNFGSKDYQKLDDEMKKIFKSIVNTNLEPFLSLIDAKTLVIFGENDKETPVYMAKKLHSGIKNSNIKLISNAGHFCFNDKRFEFVDALKKFVEEG